MSTKGLMVVLGLAMTLSHTYAQSLFSARAFSLGAYGAFAGDSRGFNSNPAGLVGMRDWEFTTSTFTAKSNTGFVFQGLTFGKRFLENEAVALQYAPGSLLEFIIPSGLTVNTGDSVISLDKKVSYSELFSFGFAHRFSDALSVGLGVRLRGEKVTDTQYRITPKVEITATDYSSDITLGDVSVAWLPLPALTVVGLAKNLFSIRSATLPGDLGTYELPVRRIFEVTAKYDLTSTLSVSAMGSTKEYGAIGGELKFPGMNCAVRGSAYLNNAESPFVYAYAFGVGWKYEFLEADIGYLGFVNQTIHGGTFAANDFSASRIHSIDLNGYTRNRFAFSLKAIFGNVRESLVRIEGVEISSGVYPSSFELFAYRAIGTVRVKNISAKPVQAAVSCFVESYMDAPTEMTPEYLLPGEEKEIPFNAVLNDKVRGVRKLTVREANVYVRATGGDQVDDRIQTKILIHGRNDWDGDVHSLRNFVTPDDPEVLRYTRDILLQLKDSLAAVPRELESLLKAKLLFNAFAGKLVYVGDPKQSSDYVQYPSETLTMKSGDCDDMTVCFASLLSSVGISTAFVDVVPPQSPEKSHIYLMFDTGLDPKFGPRLSDNPKRYVARTNAKGEETLWLPIETTVITKGFDVAWSVGAQEYLEDVEINLGLVKGWVRVVDVN